MLEIFAPANRETDYVILGSYGNHKPSATLVRWCNSEIIMVHGKDCLN